jgi:hypothetical protein
MSEVRVQHFERDRAAVAEIVREIDSCHAAPPKLAFKQVAVTQGVTQRGEGVGHCNWAIARPIQRRLEHPQIALDRAGTHRIASDTTFPAPNHVLTNAIRCEFFDGQLGPKVLGQVLTHLGHVLQIGFGFQRTVRVVSGFRHIPREQGA